MKNLEIADIFFDIANILEMKKVKWKPQAYRKAARSIQSLSESIEEIYKKEGKKGLDNIPGVGERLAEKIEEYLKTGKIKEYEKLKKQTPESLIKIMDIPGLGPKTAQKLYKKLKIKSIKDLEKAAKKHKISKLKNFKEKTEENILEGIKLMRSSKGRHLLGNSLIMAKNIEEELKKTNSINKISNAGSLRRMEETIGDLDILVDTSHPKKVMEKFASLNEIKKIIAKGNTKSSIILKNNIQVDLRVIPSKNFGSALQYFTGNKDHNIKLRKIAIKKGYKLNEYGLFKKNRYICGKTEKEIYKKLGLQYMPPEMRRNMGEIDLALKKKIPKVVDYRDIKGDLHIHTKASDGSNTIQEIVQKAKKLGYSYICISDHSKTRAISHGLNEKRLNEQIKQIDRLNKKQKNFKILKGLEVDILNDGSLDLPDRILKKLDLVTASIHSGFKMPKSKMTNRILNALENKYVKVLGHPTGRIINRRKPYNIDLEQIFEIAKEKNKFMEINCAQERLDLNAENIKKALEYKIKFVLGTDAHNLENMNFINLGIAQARAGFATKKDILNCLTIKEIKKALKR